ncbi:MAG TPA: hypothetical protein VFV10_04305, partial [Gammaproteobacteria bacterium]|nr:hypothetical protein [Gammaproteobacteria bacterium]
MARSIRKSIRIASTVFALTVFALAAGLLTASARAAEPTLRLCLDEAADGTPVYPGNVFPNSTGG